MSDGTRHEAIVFAALRRVGRAGEVDLGNVRLLAGGLSGSAVYRLDLAGEEVVLKVTLPSKDRGLMERARREAWFYRDLAPRVPVAVPRLLGLDVNATDGVVLLLAAHAPAPRPDDWTKGDYVQIAEQLALFHATFWTNTAASDLPDWLRAEPPMTLSQCQTAAKMWRTLGERDDLRETFVPYRRRLERLLVEIPALDPRMPSVPATLCHGDCHAGNLVRGPAGEWIWVDWQDVRLGPGVDDLTFFWQRAFVLAATSPSYDGMLRAYGRGLETMGGVAMPREQFEQSLAWSELRSWLVVWPAFLGGLPAARMERVLQRIGTLIDQFDIGDR